MNQEYTAEVLNFQPGTKVILTHISSQISFVARLNQQHFEGHSIVKDSEILRRLLADGNYNVVFGERVQIIITLDFSYISDNFTINLDVELNGLYEKLGAVLNSPQSDPVPELTSEPEMVMEQRGQDFMEILTRLEKLENATSEALNE